MSRIQDKKRWFAVMCCRSQTACPVNSFFGLNFGLGMVGAFAGLLAIALLVSAVSVHAAGHGIAIVMVSDQLKQLRATKAEDAQKIYTDADTAKRPVTLEEKTRFDSLMTEVDDLGVRIDAQVKIEKVLNDKPTAVPQITQDVDTSSSRIQFTATHKLKAFVSGSFGDRVKAETTAYRCGKWLAAVINKDPRAMQYCVDNAVFGYGTSQVIHNVHEEGVNSTGGVLVPAEFENAIIDLREQYGMLRRLAKIVTMGSDTKNQPRRTGGLQAFPMAESGLFTESTKNWDNVSLNAKLWGVLSKFSTSFGEDAVIDVADDLASESAYAFTIAEDDAGLNGDGTSKYGGIVGVLTKFAPFVDQAGSGAVNPATATHDLFSEMDGDDIDLLIATLPQYADANARFIASRVCKSLVFDPLLRAGGGNTKSDIAGRMLNTYLGYPIEISQKMPNGTATSYQNLPMFLFGDFSAAVSMGVRRGITIQVLNELFAPNGQIGLICSERFDINCHDVGNITTPGPLVAMIGSSS